MKKQLIRAAATSVLGLSLMTGFAAADAGTTGPNSRTSDNYNSNNTAQLANNNNLSANHSSNQGAYTGSTNDTDNTLGGDAASGAAVNANSVGGGATVTNTGMGAFLATAGTSTGADEGAGFGTTGITGPNSTVDSNYNQSSYLSMTNNNNVNVSSNSSQTATTGTANVNDNTVGGSAVSGDAANTSDSTFTLSVSN